ncbi:MAG: hypothetical protein JO179_15900 [Solirubrobacterales bacterium]|nr:hypothetical protein [Solirubrobacterales bacterium]
MELAGGPLIFAAFVVVYFLVLAFSLYTRSGSAINQHPYRDPYGDAPGAARRSSLAHDERATIRFPRGLR